MAHPQCEAAVFCRVNPKQKGLIVKSCRDRLKSGCVLAIGDGANDISMIKEAHVGVGIYGEEGWQAAGSADYAITKFKDLYRLLFIHGRWNYARITFFISFFVYKNFAFTFLQFWMAMYSMWTGISVLDDVCLLAFNTFFMVAPLFAAGLFDKDINPDEDRPSKGTIQHPPSIDDTKWYVQIVPKLYSKGQLNVLFSSKRLIGWLILGLCHSIFIYFGVFGTWSFAAGQAIEESGRTSSFSMDQQALYTILLMMLVALHATLVSEWNWLYLFCVIVLHVVLYICFAAVYDRYFTTPYNFIADATLGNWVFWFMFFGVIAVCIVPIIAMRRYRMFTRPSFVDVITCKKTIYRKPASRLQTLKQVHLATVTDPVASSTT
jgi:magnesium-transporting ATPase (P-type)